MDSLHWSSRSPIGVIVIFVFVLLLGTAVTVPRDALFIRQNHAYVMRGTRSNTVEELDVTPGAGTEDGVEVRGPLAAGDRLVVRGGERLAARQAVRVIDPVQRVPQTHPG